MDENEKRFNWMTRLLAKRCDVCPLCKYAREKPDTWIAKVMQFHGRFCPAWRAHVKVYGE